MLIVHGATDLRLVVLLMCCDILLLETTKVIKLWCAGLEWTAQKQLRRQKRSKVHIHRCARCSHIACALMIRLPVCSSVDGHIPATRMPLSIATDRMLIRTICAMRKASIIVAGI